ncbi:MAG: MlaD family protein [Candidatus Omnitrophica bacterium]|nr:MlaD family protein [Candidatus Omnitrophota bacterium]MDD5436627.1 MlaD family protein [Candidatus Omnitrophota bacterium]
MDSTKTFELKVGLFIMIGVTILFFIVFSIGGMNFSKTGYKIRVLFSFANGIGGTAPVRLAGVGVGQVQGIRIVRDEKTAATKAELTVWINDNTKIEDDSVVTINTLGLLGEKYLEIFPGTPGTPTLQNNDMIVGKDPVPMEKFTDNLAKLTDSVTVIVDKIKSGEGTLGKLLMDSAVYDNLEAFTADIKKHPWKLLVKPSGD